MAPGEQVANDRRGCAVPRTGVVRRLWCVLDRELSQLSGVIPCKPAGQAVHSTTRSVASRFGQRTCTPGVVNAPPSFANLSSATTSTLENKLVLRPE